jgi:L-ascorbate metabolism protein UlaG (beta-lactamase superfamily)
MNRRAFSKLALGALPFMSFAKKPTWSVQLLRHATLIVKNKRTTFLVDPMLSPKGAMDPVANAGNDIRIPMTDLPFRIERQLKEADAILVTHTHRDHWDAVAQKMIDKSKPIFCQPTDLEKIRSQGFTNVNAHEDTFEFKGITINVVDGHHGVGEEHQNMGDVCGFMLQQNGHTLYIAGDTVWCEEVMENMRRHKPQTIVVNAGGAQFVTGTPITMDIQDVTTTMKHSHGSTIVAVHMDTINHCKITREIFRKYVAENNLRDILIPNDGETLTF